MALVSIFKQVNPDAPTEHFLDLKLKPLKLLYTMVCFFSVNTELCCEVKNVLWSWSGCFYVSPGPVHSCFWLVLMCKWLFVSTCGPARVWTWSLKTGSGSSCPPTA